MKKSVMKKWVAALRSGEYKQNAGINLKTDLGYCCLGVLCEVMNVPSIRNINGKYSFEEEYGGLPLSVIKKAQISHYLGRALDNSFQLSSLNDSGHRDCIGEGRFTFEEIADIIELEYKNL